MEVKKDFESRGPSMADRSASNNATAGLVSVLDMTSMSQPLEMTYEEKQKLVDPTSVLTRLHQYVKNNKEDMLRS